MLNRIFKITIAQKNIRRFIRRFFRTRYESISNTHFDIKPILAHRVLMSLYRNFDAKKKIFGTISIQTQTGCNYNCPFCPANKPGLNLYGGAAPGAKMDFNLFKSIIDQLSKLAFKGRISPDAMNEPLIDERLTDLVSIIKRKCPHAFLFIQTNGSLLNKKLIVELIKAGINEIYVNDYTEGEAILSRLANMSLDKRYRIHITLERRSFTERLSNRAGNIKLSRELAEPLKIPCVKPFRQINITYDGRAILCCQDWQFTQVLGDAKRETLLDIWTNEFYDKIRNELKNYNRANNLLCAKCDFSGLW